MSRGDRQKGHDPPDVSRYSGENPATGAHDQPQAPIRSTRRSSITWLLAFLFLTAGIGAVRREIIDSPPYYDFATGLFVEADFLARTNFDYTALFYEQDRWLLGGAGVYLTSVLPTFLAVLMKVLPTARDVLMAFHLFTFACASLTALVVYALVRRQTNRVGGILIAAGLLTLPIFSVQIDMLGMDLPMTACGVVAAWLAVNERYAWASFASTMAYLMKATGMLVTVSLWLYLAVVILFGHRTATASIRRKRWLGLGACSVALALQFTLNQWVAQIPRDSNIESWNVSQRLFFGENMIRFTPYWFPDVLVLLAIALVGTLIIVLADAATRQTARHSRGVIPAVVRFLSAAFMRRRAVFFGWIVIGLLAGVMTMRYVLPRYCTLGAPFLFVILGTILFSFESLRRIAAVAVCVLIMLNLANWNGDFYPGQDFARRTGALLERSHEYLKDHRSNIEVVRLLVAEHDGVPIIAPAPFVQFLTLPSLGYVDEPLEGYSLSRFTGPTFRTKTQIRDDAPREAIMVFVESGYSPPGEVPRPAAESEILRRPSGEAAIWREPSDLIVYRKTFPASFTDADVSDWYWIHLWREKRVLNVAVALLAEKKYIEAETKFREVLAATPLDTDALYGLAFTQYSRGYIDDARKTLDTLLETDSKHGRAHELLGTILFTAGNKEEGIAHLRLAVLYPAEDAEAHAQTDYLLGSMLASTGEKAEAEGYYRRAIELDPSHADAQHLYGRLIAGRGELREGLDHILKAIELRPDHAEALYDAGQVEEALGDVEDAIEHYRRAMDVRIGWPEPANNLAMILATHPDEEIRDGKEAVRCAEIACEISAEEHPDPIFLDTLAAAYAEADRFDEAVETSSLAIQLFEARGGGKQILDGMRARLELYKNGRPYHVAPKQSGP